MTNRTRALLISNSKSHGGGYLDHCEVAIQQFLGSIRSILFFPFALKDWEAYTATAYERFERMGIKLTSAHRVESYQDFDRAIQSAKAFFVGGGNTFRLLATLQEKSWIGRSSLRAIGERVMEGVPYIGTSAGANLACPTIKTTNDMPIVHPNRFAAIGIVPYQINPHYIDADPNSTHMGETRERRITEFHEENHLSVIGLREGAWLRVEDGQTHLEGMTGAKLFRRGKEPIELVNGQVDGDLLVP